MKVGHLLGMPAEVNGTKPKSLRTGQNASQTAKEPSKENFSLLDSRSHLMGVFSDDFAAVDVREELCYHSRPKKTNLRGRK